MTQLTPGKRFNIVSHSTNPSKADLIDAFSRTYDRQDNTTIRFQTDDPNIGHLHVSLIEIGYESGGGLQFCFEGFTSVGKEHVSLVGYYHSVDRNGWMEIKK